LDVWTKDYHANDVYEAMKELPDWFKHSGIYQSNNEDDILIASIKKMDFLLDYKSHFTVDQARELIKVLFPTKTKKIFEGSSSYGFKHLFEVISKSAIDSKYDMNKYCSNATAINAFELEGFDWIQEGPNRYMNLSAKEVNKVYKLFRYN